MIGVLGGTFDPVHHGHLRIALDAVEALGLREVRLIPLGQAVHREQPRATAQQRLTMLHLAVERHLRFTVDAREIARGGPSYMVDTLTSLRTEYPDTPLCLLLGGDAFAGFARWRDSGRILQLAHLAVLTRRGEPRSDDPALRALIANRRCAQDVLATYPHGKLTHIDVTQLAIASSDIRARIVAGGDPAFLLPDPVLDYIREQDLYRVV